MARKKIGEMLIEAGLLDQTGLRAGLVEQRRWGGPLGRILIDMKLVAEEQLVAALSRQLAIPTVDIDRMTIAPAIIDLVPGDLAEQQSLVPFAQPMKFLDVAMSDPTNLGIIDELRIRTQLNVRPYLAGPKALERAIAHYYGRGFGAVTSSRGGAAGMASGLIDFDPSDAGRPMEVIRSGLGQHETPALAGSIDIGLPSPTRPAGRDAEIQALQERISKLEALVARDEDVLRKLLGLLVEKGVASRDEILERIK
jgi:type IV pilus assembly protein PilB